MNKGSKTVAWVVGMHILLAIRICYAGLKLYELAQPYLSLILNYRQNNEKLYFKN